MRRDDIPYSMPTTNRPRNAGSAISDDASRLDAVAKVTGQAIYSRDRYLPNSLFAGFIFCPYGKAKLESHASEAAKKIPGVVEVEISGREGQYHGHTVGHVLAESPEALRRGLAAVACKWVREPVRTKIRDGELAEPSPNAKTSDILAKADHVLEAEYETQVQTHCCLEPHGATIDHKGESATCYISTQGTFAATDGLSDAIGLPRSKYEVICEYIGGGFGSKLNGAGKEGVLAARLSAGHNRPVYLFRTREEDQTDTGNRPSGLARVKIGFTKDGTILGGLVQKFGGVGVGRGGGGMSFPSGRYNLGDIQSDHDDVRFNGGAPRPFRAPGHPQGAFCEELMLDEIATKAGVDPLALRLNLENSGARKEMLELGAEIVGWKNRAKTGSQAGVIRRGFGIGSAAWGSGQGRTDCEVVINRDGSIEARTGTQDIGTGQRTTMAIMTAEAIGVPLAFVGVRIGSSNLPVGPGSGGSVTTPSTAPVMAAAAARAREQLLTTIANLNSADASEFDVKGGEILRAGKPFMTWAQACAKIGGEQIVGRAKQGEGERGKGHSDGVQFVDLRVDTDTGVVYVDRVIAVQSCGRVICRKTAESQIIGGVIQGLSYALFENQVLDRNAGSMLNANMESYKILGPNDMPHIEPVLWTKGATGVRSLGEPPVVPTAGAVACAVFNAIGTPVRSIPLTPDKVLAALAGGGA
ncbi:MAG: xanthine dehydrogenase family protein molybdopterin-binding subunit [Phycisphaerales bacterium]|nr:xanthine dehydrogenase family protein molybdopterin-binding subunit [Phycisphaerales bacterium]